MAIVTSAFKLRCWRYVKLGDLIDEMTPEQRQVRSWPDQPKDIIMAKIICSAEACHMMHPAEHANSPQCSEGLDNTLEQIQVGNPVSIANWGSDISIIDIDCDNDEFLKPNGNGTTQLCSFMFLRSIFMLRVHLILSLGILFRI